MTTCPPFRTLHCRSTAGSVHDDIVPTMHEDSATEVVATAVVSVSYSILPRPLYSKKRGEKGKKEKRKKVNKMSQYKKRLLSDDHIAKRRRGVFFFFTQKKKGN